MPDPDSKTWPDEAAMLRAVGFWRVLGEDIRQHRREWSRPGLHTLLVHRIGVYAKTLAMPLRLPLDLVYVLGWRFCRSFYGIELRRSTFIGRRFEIGHQHGIVLHDYARFGDDCVVHQGVTFGISTEWEKGKGPVIGNDVSFGVGAVIIGNVTIGDNVTVGPNCVVSTDVPANRTLFVPPPRALPKADTIDATD